MDCLVAMRQMPDNAFDLAVVDPPYGAGFTEGGGCKGWFSKYHQDSSQVVNVERERENCPTRQTCQSFTTIGQSSEQNGMWSIGLPTADNRKNLSKLLAAALPRQSNGLELTSFETIRPKSVRQYNPDPTVADYESGEALLREWIYNFK